MVCSSLVSFWNVSFKGVFASFFAVAGIALFASWSILSNITASVILFFNFPFKIGSRIRIMDLDDSVEGVVKDITFFAILIEIDNGGLVSFPNNMAIQKAIVHVKEKPLEKKQIE
jgi:MscS family membrane protein